MAVSLFLVCTVPEHRVVSEALQPLSASKRLSDTQCQSTAEGR